VSSRTAEKNRAREARIAAQRAAELAASRRKRLLTFGGVIAVAAAVVLAAVLISQAGTKDTTPVSERIALFEGIPQDATLLGSDDAPVVVEEYADMQCPFCARFAEADLPAIVRDRVRSGDVQLRLRMLAFLGEDSVEAARFAAAAGLQDRQWQFVDAFYARQGDENSGYVDEGFLRGVAGQVPGLDADRAFADLDDPAVARQLGEAVAAAKDAAIDSTPTFRVGRRDGELRVVTGDELPGAISEALQGL
jgi:protein-disulfide isomerase